MADFGRVQPIYGRWSWPYRQMEEGDEFHVRYEDRAPEDVRQLASVRAAQLGIRLSCRRDDESGVIRIKRVPFDRDSLNVLPKALDYEQGRALIQRLYEINADALPWGQAIEPGETVRHCATRIAGDPRRLVEIAVAGHRYAVELGDDRIVATCIDGQSLKGWIEARLGDMLE